MSRKFIFSVVASAIAVTGVFAAPAKASGDDIAKILFGVATLYVISEALDDDEPVVNTASNQRYGYNYDRNNPRNLPPRNGYYAPIPSHCVKHVHTRNGTTRLVSRDCVNRHYPNARDLPRGCRSNVMTNHGVYHGYNQRCLRNNGFTVAKY